MIFILATRSRLPRLSDFGVGVSNRALNGLLVLLYSKNLVCLFWLQSLTTIWIEHRRGIAGNCSISQCYVLRGATRGPFSVFL